MIFILVLLSIGIMIAGLLYTFRLGKVERAQFDTTIPTKVQAHPYLRNPIFIAYLVFFALALGFLVFVAVRS